MPAPEKFKKTLQEYSISSEVMDRIYEGFENITDKSAKKDKVAFFTQALHVMKESLSEVEVKDIIEANACCKSGTRERNSKQFAKEYKDLSIPERLQLISERPHLNMGKAELDEQGFLMVYGVSYRVDGKFECACPTVNKIKRDYDIPREYCYCCGGHFKYHYEIMLGVKLELVEIVSSPHDTHGEKACVFKYQIR